eukprot:CAMPEP_0113495034 /NCGR_PEP_ID=MMETSP0014_2-20120614/29406_1 /TAXON_ID=2857 /ORGANISM="Nitzschia sp." /LENGTH=855 /DNA_ID=CAMNT_0000388929 /DNA_START=571 /DNA_END=3138 /DNA_ORIENTATION=- /assembly_acc=CAM_ASM_000159
MTSTTSMKTLSEDNVNHQADTGTCFPRRLEERQNRQYLQQLREQGMKQVQGQSQSQLHHHNHNRTRGGAVGSGIVEEHLAGLGLPNNSSKTATTNSITENNENVKTLKQIIRERMQDGEEEAGGKKVIIDDDFENELDMYAPVALSDIETYDMESERVGREIFDFEFGRKHQGGRRDDDQVEEKGFVSSGVVWINELPMDLTAWDWYPSLEGLRKGKGFGESPVCVTETDHFTEYDRINFLQAPSALEGQAGSGPSIEMTDDMDEEDFSNVFEDDFKPSTFKDPLPSLKTAGGSKAPPKKVSSNVFDTKSVLLQKETGVDDASTTFDFPDNVWAAHTASDGKYARAFPRDSNCVPMTGDEVDACSSLCDLHRASSRTLAPSMTLEVVPKMPSNVARRHHKNVKISTEVPSTNPRVLFPSAVSDDFGRDVSTTVTKDLMHDSHQEKFVDTAWLEPSQIAPFKHTPNWLQKPSKGKEYFSLTQVAMNLIADDSRSLLHSIHSAGTKPKETKAATQTTHRASRSAKTKAKRTIKTAVASRRPKYRLPSSQTTNGSALSRAKRGAESSISSTIVSPVERMCSGRPRGLGVVLGPSLRTVKWPDATEQERANLKDGKKVRAPSDPSSRAASTSGKDVPGRRQKRTVKARIVSRKKQQEGMVRKKSPPRLLERDQERSTPLTKSPTEVAATVSSGPVFNSTYNEKWKKNVERFEVFRKKHGHGCVPVKYPEDQILAGWATRQRMHYARYVGSSKGKTLLTVERVEELTRLGFCWDNFQRGWYAKFDMLSKYVEKHGSIKGASSRNNRKAYPGLSAWLRFQRKVFKDYLTREARAKLKDDQEERFKLLEGLDMNWLLIDDDV